MAERARGAAAGRLPGVVDVAPEQIDQFGLAPLRVVERASLSAYRLNENPAPATPVMNPSGLVLNGIVMWAVDLADAPARAERGGGPLLRREAAQEGDKPFPLGPGLADQVV